jgi:uncharacterized protein
VVDRSSLLAPETRRSLEQSLAEFERTTGHQIVAHVTPSLEGLPIEDYSMQVAQAWRIGQKGLDNGVIFTIAPNERELRIEVGYGLEGCCPTRSRLGSSASRSPRHSARGHGRGVLAGVRDHGRGQGESLPLPARKREGLPWYATALFVLLLFTLPSWLRALAAASAAPGWARATAGRTGGAGAGAADRRRGGFGGGVPGGGGGFGGGGASGAGDAGSRTCSTGGIRAIEAAVRDAERRTSGEIVPVLAERSDEYAEVRLVAAALLAPGAGVLWLAFAPGRDLWLLPTQFGVFAVVAWLSGRRALLRLLAPGAWLAERVQRAAELAFHQLGMVETRDRTGILIYVSLLERRVVVLADRGIQSAWPKVPGTASSRASSKASAAARPTKGWSRHPHVRRDPRPARAGGARRPERATGPPARRLTPSSDTSGTRRTGCAGAG